MNENHITQFELLQLIAIFVAPFLIAGAVVQYFILRRTVAQKLTLATILGLTSVLTLAITFVGLFGVPHLTLALGADLDMFGYGDPLVVSALCATTLVTLSVYWFAKKRASSHSGMSPRTKP